MTPKECRNLANKHRRQADSEPDPAKRETMLTLAAQFEALADSIERENGRSSQED